MAQAAPFIQIKRRPKLRVLGTHVTLQEPLRLKAQEDLGIDIVFEPGGSAEVLQKASTRPASFDIYEQWSNSIDILWQARAIQAIDQSRLGRWGEVNGLCKVGRLSPGAPLGAGAAPVKMLYAQPDGTLGREATGRLSFLPYVHNVDSFGYNAQVVGEGKAYETESWSQLLDSRWSGRVGIVNEPTIGLFDLVLACQAKGLMKFGDIGAITRTELDELFEIVVRLKRDGHFSAFWTSVPHSVDLMAEGRVVIESMFSPAVSALNGAGHDVIYAAPREGYRAWHGVMCLSSAATEEATGRLSFLPYVHNVDSFG
ncbi:MAG: extracellular solute-binding protein, partial [Planctomycetota bacterium]